MSQITTASLKISILALLFIVTAAPHIRDYGGTKLHQENASKGGIVANETLLDAVAPINGFNPNTNNDQPFGDGDGKHELSSNKLGFSHHANVDKVTPTTNKLGQASRNSSDAVSPPITTTPSFAEVQAAQGKAEFVQGVAKAAEEDKVKGLRRKIGK